MLRLQVLCFVFLRDLASLHLVFSWGLFPLADDSLPPASQLVCLRACQDYVYEMVGKISSLIE